MLCLSNVQDRGTGSEQWDPGASCTRLLWGQSLGKHRGCLPAVLGRLLRVVCEQRRPQLEISDCPAGHKELHRAQGTTEAAASSNREQETGSDSQVLCRGFASGLSSQRRFGAAVYGLDPSHHSSEKKDIFIKS